MKKHIFLTQAISFCYDLIIYLCFALVYYYITFESIQASYI